MSSRLFYEHTTASLAGRHDFDRDAYYEEASGKKQSAGRGMPTADDPSVVSTKSLKNFLRQQRRAVDDRSVQSSPTAVSKSRSRHRSVSPRRPLTNNPRSLTAPRTRAKSAPRTRSTKALADDSPPIRIYETSKLNRSNAKSTSLATSRNSSRNLQKSQTKTRIMVSERNASTPLTKSRGGKSPKTLNSTSKTAAKPKSFFDSHKSSPSEPIAVLPVAAASPCLNESVDDDLDDILGASPKESTVSFALGIDSSDLVTDNIDDTPVDEEVVFDTEVTASDLYEGVDYADAEGVKSDRGDKDLPLGSIGVLATAAMTAQETELSTIPEVHANHELSEEHDTNPNPISNGTGPVANSFTNGNGKSNESQKASQQLKKSVAISEPSTNSELSESLSAASVSENSTSSSRKGASRKGLFASRTKSDRSPSVGSQRSRGKKKALLPVLISCKYNPSRGFSDFQVKKYKKVYRGLVDYEKGKMTAKSLARVIIEELFERDFWPGKHWDIDSANVWESTDSEHPSFNAEKLATWDWKDIYSEASATAVIRFHPDRILIENYAYYVAG